jgi:SAM-dependent methyltransferase
VVGVDLTAAMLAKVDRSSGNIEVFETDTATLPFPDDTFDVCTAYSFLHHLYDLRPTLREAFRCLRPGGSFFSDADPNRAFWQSMVDLRRESELSGVVAREARSVLDAGREIAESTGLSPETVALAEFQKISLGGLDAEGTADLIRSVGFSTVDFRYEWYIGEGKAIHERSPRDADMIGDHLRDMLPATRALFKYISFRATK